MYSIVVLKKTNMEQNISITVYIKWKLSCTSLSLLNKLSKAVLGVQCCTLLLTSDVKKLFHIGLLNAFFLENHPFVTSCLPNNPSTKESI